MFESLTRSRRASQPGPNSWTKPCHAETETQHEAGATPAFFFLIFSIRAPCGAALRAVGREKGVGSRPRGEPGGAFPMGGKLERSQPKIDIPFPLRVLTSLPVPPLSSPSVPFSLACANVHVPSRSTVFILQPACDLGPPRPTRARPSVRNRAIPRPLPGRPALQRSPPAPSPPARSPAPRAKT